MSEADTRPRTGDDPTPEDYRHIASELREAGLELLPPKLERYADQLEDDGDE